MYFIDIGQNTSLEIIEIGESELLFEFADGLGASSADLAMHDHGSVPVDLSAVGGDAAEGDQFGPDVDDIVLMRFAYIDQLEFFSPYLPVVEFSRGNFFQLAFFDCAHAAECLIINEGSDGGVIAIDRIVLASADGEGSAFEVQGVEDIEAAGECFAYACDDLDDFQCLEAADDARQDAEDAAFGAAGYQARRGRGRIEVAVIGAEFALSVAVIEDGHLAFELEDGGVDVGFAEQDGSVVDEVAGREVVGAVDDDVEIGRATSELQSPC